MHPKVRPWFDFEAIGTWLARNVASLRQSPQLLITLQHPWWSLPPSEANTCGKDMIESGGNGSSSCGLAN